MGDTATGTVALAQVSSLQFSEQKRQEVSITFNCTSQEDNKLSNINCKEALCESTH